jgi:hypothetical protein
MLVWSQLSSPPFIFRNLGGRFVTSAGSFVDPQFNLGSLLVEKLAVTAGPSGDFLPVIVDIPDALNVAVMAGSFSTAPTNDSSRSAGGMHPGVLPEILEVVAIMKFVYPFVRGRPGDKPSFEFPTQLKAGT